MIKRLGYILMIAAGLAACSQPVDDHGLAAARARWASHAPASYRFDWRRGCECPAEVYRPIEITVVSGQITTAVYTDDHSPVADQFRTTLRTIDGVFDDLQKAVDQHAAEIQLSFDPVLSYPTSVFVDYSHQAADEELSLQISGLMPTQVK
jgi:hypothetical protein